MVVRKDPGKHGLTDRKICVAVTVGVLLGLLFAFVNMKDKSTFLRGGNREMEAVRIKSALGDNAEVKGERERLLQEKEDLAKQLEAAHQKEVELTRQLEEARQQKGGAVGQSQTSPGKAGPRGTVVGQRTSPTVEPDLSVNPDLAAQLEKVAVNKELIVALATSNIQGMLKVWFEGIKRVGITNYMVAALDDQTVQYCKENGVPAYRAIISDAQKGAGDNHAISGLKFHVLREFLVMGYNVLLSDVDIVFLRNPFEHLFRDCDVEGMTDGFNNATAYGYNDVTDDPAMGWARYAHTMRVFVMNSGLFYIRPTISSIELLDRVTARLQKERHAWDQAVFNEELWFPSRPGYRGLHASRRIMDYYDFLNSKVLFREVRKDQRFNNHVPITVHVNYHPEKYERMLAIVDYYVNGNKQALNPFPDGSIQ